MNVLVVGGDPVTRAEVAEAFHRESPVRSGPLVAIDAARQAGPLLAALRAWTSGVPSAVPVALAAAERGTLFIDGIEHLDAESQLRLLELAGHGMDEVAARPGRLVVGGSEDPSEAVDAGSFSAALYDSLDKVRIELPAHERGAA